MIGLKHQLEEISSCSFTVSLEDILCIYSLVHGLPLELCLIKKPQTLSTFKGFNQNRQANKRHKGISSVAAACMNLFLLYVCYAWRFTILWQLGKAAIRINV